MVKALCSFTVCQVVTLRDVKLSWTKIQKKTTKNPGRYHSNSQRFLLRYNIQSCSKTNSQKIWSFFENAKKDSLKKKANIFVQNCQNGVSVWSGSPSHTDKNVVLVMNCCKLFGNFEKLRSEKCLSSTLFFNKIMLLCIN